MYLADPKTAGCFTSSAHPQLSLKLQISQLLFLSSDQMGALAFCGHLTKWGFLGHLTKKGWCTEGLLGCINASKPSHP